MGRADLGRLASWGILADAIFEGHCCPCSRDRALQGGPLGFVWVPRDSPAWVLALCLQWQPRDWGTTRVRPAQGRRLGWSQVIAPFPAQSL